MGLEQIESKKQGQNEIKAYKIRETQKELENLKIDTLKSELKKEAPLYSREIDKIEDGKRLEEILEKVRFAKSILGENFDKLFLKGEEINGFKVEGLKLEDLLRFLNELENEEVKKEIANVKTVILTLDELKQLERVIATEDIKDDLDFIKSQIEENVSSYEILMEDKEFISKLESFLKSKCKNKQECKVENFLDGIDNKIFKFLKEVFPEDVSLDTLRNMATGFNLGLMIFFNDLNKEQKKVFLDFLIGFNELINANSALNKLQVLLNTGKYGYEGFKLFSYIYDFVNDVKRYAKKLNINREETREEYINLNNPTQFAFYFEKYMLAKLNNKDSEIFIKEIFSRRRQGVGLDFELEKAKQNREFNKNIMTKLEQFGRNLSEKEIEVIYNLSKDLDKVAVYKRRIEERINNYLDNVKSFGEKIVSLICAGNFENCKRGILGILYKVYNLVVDILNSLGLHIEKKWDLFPENLDLKKFNNNFINSFVKTFIAYDNYAKYYTFNENFKQTIFYKYISFLKDKKFKSIHVEGNLSKDIMNWFLQEGIDISDVEALSKKLLEILKNRNNFLQISNLKDEINKIIYLKGGRLILDLNVFDSLLKKVLGYKKGKAKEQKDTVDTKFVKVDKIGIREVSKKLGVPEEVIYAILVKESGKPAQIGKLATRLEKHKYEEFKRKGYNDDIAKKLATSYGSFQIMGFNYKRCGYNSVDAFVKALMNPNYEIRRRAQIESFVNFVKSDPELWNAMKTKNWQVIAERYNGIAYKTNGYDIAIKNFSEEYRVA